MPTMKITFKKCKKETGKRGVGYPFANVSIRVDKKECGIISAPNWHKEGWTVRFQVVKKDLLEDGNPNCTWRWFPPTNIFPSEEAAREAASKIIENIISKGYRLYFSIN